MFADTDAMGIVYYGSYLRFFEMGRNAFLRDRGGDARTVTDMGVQLPVIEVGARYIAPARVDDEILVATRLDSFERVRMRFVFRITRGEEKLTEGFTVHACVNLETGRAKRCPEGLRTLLTQP
jgi:acyl-CoA thioester hydrolase